jgi:hypothetical protein
MGIIRDDVQNGHLLEFPEEEGLLKPFLSGFDITWARRREAYNTALSVYFLKPEPCISQLFGFEHEIALFVADYPTIEARTMQASDTLIGGDPARGRVDQSIFFLSTPAHNGSEWVGDYTARNPQARIPVVFRADQLRAANNEAWYVRNVVRDQLFSRDLFDYQLPLDSDLFFFGREQIVADHMDAIRRSQNRGLFGLRKTGKTSILYKLKRLMDREALGAFLYYDCKLPSIRMLKWHELLARIIRDIAAAYHLVAPAALDDPRTIADHLIAILQATPTDKSTALVFDEIEYVSPLAIDDVHWHKEFVPFWQTLWAAQSQIRRLSNTVVGVNPKVVEMDTIDGVQNPMFGIIQPRYLRGLAADETRGMIRFFGRRMGLKFEFEACDYLHTRYGGHPLLTRMACSEANAAVELRNRARPVEIERVDLERDAESRDAELAFYCRHVVSELKKFYPDEYELLEMLASGEVADVMDLSVEPEFTRHLREYGLLQIDGAGRPSFAIPVVGKHIGNEVARREGRRLIRRLVAPEDRVPWVRRRAEGITREIRELCRVLNEKGLPELYGTNSFPEAERFAAIRPASSNDEFVVFINICNRCLVEAVEQKGRAQGVANYFWTTVKQNYPDLWDALQRVKTYRHNDLHLELNPTANGEFRRYLEMDLEGRRVSQVPDVWFVLQQSTLDALMVGIQCELNRCS